MLIFICVIFKIFLPIKLMHSSLNPSIYRNSAGINSFMILLKFSSNFLGSSGASTQLYVTY